MNFWRLLTPENINQPIITGEYNILLCIAAVFLAILAAMIMLPVTDRYQSINHKIRNLWLLAGSLAMGIGIWAMFITNILALKLPFAVAYDIPKALVSIIPAILASASCIALYASAEVSTLRLHMAAFILAFGVGAMHYMGMEALIISAEIHYMPGLFFLSVASAYAFAMVGLNSRIMLSKSKKLSPYSGNLIGSLILGIAVTSTHFVAMSATFFLWDGSNPISPHEQLISNILLFSAIASITLFLYIFILAGTYLDKKIRSMARSLKFSEIRFKSLSETTQTAIITFNRKEITYANPALCEITGYSMEEISERSVTDVLGEDIETFSTEFIEAEVGNNKALNKQFEITTKDGNSRWIYASFAQLEIDKEKQCLINACDITEQKQLEKSLHSLAYQDHLTRLANRAKFLDELREHLEWKEKNQEKSYVMLLNIDHFSKINDTFGHQDGDTVLTEMAGRLQQLAGQLGIVARINGDEFAILLESLGTQDDISAFADWLIEQCQEPFVVCKNDMDITVSIGITSCINTHHITADLVMHEADIALHRAKEKSQARWVLYDEEIDASVKRGRLLQNELKTAIENHGIELYYQPIVDAQDHNIRGFEALSRWQRKNGEWVSPGEFIVLAENSGFITDLELWTLATAIVQIDAWNNRFENTDFYISVNISAETITDERLFPHLEILMGRYKVNPSQLKLELTERLMVEDSGNILVLLNELINLGCELMIDDFGTGYSSLSYLHKLPAKTLKVDRSFVVNIGKNDNSETIVNSIISLSKNLNLSIIAEGIETMEQAEYLSQLGSNLLQGYLFSRPMDAHSAGEMFEKQLESIASVKKNHLIDNLHKDNALVAKH